MAIVWERFKKTPLSYPAAPVPVPVGLPSPPSLYSALTETSLMETSFAALIMDGDMNIKSINEPCKKLFSGLFELEGKTFTEVFGKYLGDEKHSETAIEAIKEARNAVFSGINGYSWRGRAVIKSRVRATMTVNLYIFPRGSSSAANKTFFVLFDDVTQENKGLTQGIFTSLLGASKLKDNDTGEHITRVNYYSRALAQKIFENAGYNKYYPVVDAEFVDSIGFLAAMHDVGKIGTPDDILNKEGPLSETEWNTMREHTKNGAFILDAYPNAMAKEIALSHHERWDGKGYPYKISGDMIPLSARIVSIADVYDALRMRRSYKAAFTHEVALEKMREGRGSQFDPKLFEIFESISNNFNKIFESHNK